jgi:hypothetical protein
MGNAFDALPPLERARRYRGMASASLDLSLNAPNSETAVGYLDLAAGWLSLACGLERESEEMPIPPNERF